MNIICVLKFYSFPVELSYDVTNSSDLSLIRADFAIFIMTILLNLSLMWQIVEVCYRRLDIGKDFSLYRSESDTPTWILKTRILQLPSTLQSYWSVAWDSSLVDFVCFEELPLMSLWSVWGSSVVHSLALLRLASFKLVVGVLRLIGFDHLVCIVSLV